MAPSLSALWLIKIWLLIAIVLILVVLIAVVFQPRWLFLAALKFIPGAVYFANTNRRFVALTIDDGPAALTTPKILDTLAQYQARATFFLISSQIQGCESIISRMVQEGHELGNHLTQDEPSIRLMPEAFEASVVEAHNVISKFAAVRWLRPASGWYNASMLATAQKYGYQVALGCLFPYDTHISLPWFAARYILMNVRPGAIIVLHDGGLRGQRTATALEILLPALQRQGYQVVTLSELMPLAQEQSALL